jgi:hypothetical protein
MRPLIPCEARDAREHNAWVDLLQRVVIDPEPEFDVRAIIFDHHVGGLGQAREDLARLGQLQVQRHRPLIAVQVLHVGAMPRPAHAFIGIDPRRRLDLDDVGTEIGELLDAGRPGPYPGQVEDAKARERARSCNSGHGGIF